MDKPLSTLFFYAPSEQLTLLKSGYLPLLDDLSLLDPYVAYDRWHQGRAHPVTEQEFERELQHEYQRLPESIRALLSWEDFQAQSDKLADQIHQRVLAHRSSDHRGYDVRRMNQAYYQRLFPSATSHFGWKTLAQGRGFCVGFHQPSSLLSASSGKPVILQPVRYGKAHAPEVSSHNPVPGLFCDDAENEARAEWRLAVPKATLEQPRLKWSKGDLHSIYLSVECTDELWQQVRQLLRHDQRFRHVTLFEVFPDAQRWRLSARPVSMTD